MDCHFQVTPNCLVSGITRFQYLVYTVFVLVVGINDVGELFHVHLAFYFVTVVTVCAVCAFVNMYTGLFIFIFQPRVSLSPVKLQTLSKLCNFQNPWHIFGSGCACTDCFLLKQIPEKWDRTVPSSHR